MEASDNQDPANLRMLLEDYIRLLDNDVRIIRNQDQTLSVKAATMLAIRRDGGHILKEAKNVRQLLGAIYDFKEVPSQDKDAPSAEDYLLAIKSHWAPGSKGYQQWQYLVGHVEQRKDQQAESQCQQALVRLQSCPNTEDISIGIWLGAVLTTA